MNEQESLLRPAPAKVNLFLSVGGHRPDGYHDVVTILQEVDFADTVAVEPAGQNSVVMRPDLGFPQEDNLAYRAVEALIARLGTDASFRVAITKRIPAGAGLGGGSSDAAATLLAVSRLLGVDPLSSEVREVAASLGADVPFFLTGGTALFGGRGDELVRVLPAPELDLVLAAPSVSIPTEAAYAAFDNSPTPGGSHDEMIAAIESGSPEAIASALYNNLTEPAALLVPETVELISRLDSLDGVLGASLSGSGSAVFGVCESAPAAERASEALIAEGWWSTTARSRANVR